MPLGIARVEFVFECQGYGWTENYFIADGTGSLSVATARSLILLTKRVGILAEPAKITYRSISDTGGQRAGQTYPVSEADGLGTYVNADKEATSLLFKRASGTGKQRSNVFLRGIPDAVVDDGGQYSPGPLFLGDLGQYQTELVTGGWGWLGDDPATNGKANIVTIADDAQSRPIFTVDQAIFGVGVVGKRVQFRVSGVQGAGNLNNAWVGLVLSTTSVKLIKPVPHFAALAGTGRVSYRDLTFIGIATSQVQRVVTRHAGRPLYHSVGRQRAQARG